MTDNDDKVADHTQNFSGERRSAQSRALRMVDGGPHFGDSRSGWLWRSLSARLVGRMVICEYRNVGRVTRAAKAFFEIAFGLRAMHPASS